MKRWQVARLIIEQAIRLAAIGILIGAAGSVWAGWLLRAHLYEIEPLDPLTIAAAVALLLATACGAGWLPACPTSLAQGVGPRDGRW